MKELKVPDMTIPRPESELMGVLAPSVMEMRADRGATIAKIRLELGDHVADMSDEEIWVMAQSIADRRWQDYVNSKRGQTPPTPRYRKKTAVDALGEAVEEARRAPDSN